MIQATWTINLMLHFNYQYLGTFQSSSQGLEGQGSSHGAQGQNVQTSPYGPQVPDDYEAEIFKNEVPTVVLYHKSFQVCYPSSSRKQLNPWYMKSPHNMLFQMKTFRKYHNKQGKEVIPKICTNAYFCFKNLDCLKLVDDGINYCDLYMGNYYFNQLTPGHVELLRQKVIGTQSYKIAIVLLLVGLLY